jgi:hypothetical protein
LTHFANRFPFALLLVLALCGHSALVRASEADASRGWDVGVRTGVVAGSLFKSTDLLGTTVTDEFSYGGLPLGLSLAFAPAPWLTLSPGFHVVFDGTSGRLTRKGIDLNGEFHVLGAARGLGEQPVDGITHGVSLLTRAGLHGYSPSSLANPDDSVIGALLEASVGAAYRLSFGQQSALSVSLLRTVLTQALGETRLRAAMTSAELEWRFYL